MRISDVILHLALARLFNGSLRYTDNYSPQILGTVWRRTGLRQRDLEASLATYVERGWLRRYQHNGRERYQLTIAGSIELHGQRAPFWKYWRVDWVLERLRRRRRGPAEAKRSMRR